MTSLRVIVTIGEEGVQADPFLPFGHRPGRDTCPVDRADLVRVALVKLAYTYETCSCGSPGYPHLVEQLWHREHVRARLATDGKLVERGEENRL